MQHQRLLIQRIRVITGACLHTPRGAVVGINYRLIYVTCARAGQTVSERRACLLKRMCNMCTRDVIETAPAAPPPPKPSRTLERMKKKHNIVTDPSSSEKQKEVEYQPDLLAVSTKYSKVAYDLFKQGLVRLQETKAYV